ncbi:MAG: SusC/RagA family TonB-linked outer membrane protein, partial [Bacteroidales bacterium]|nr:SusC/RagA family TonB-linked outer membrane protein [Bacteroidales bacterium]
DTWSSTLGFFGRLNYNYKERYLLEANIRYDGSSKFPKHLKWMWFPSVSAGWRVTEEPWMEGVKDVLSAMKLRASWGTIGDQSVAGSMYIPTMSSTLSTWIHDGARDTYFNTAGAVASDITWQMIETIDFGADLSFFNSLNITFDWFRRKTNGMIVPGPGVGYAYGTTAPQGNFGSLHTDGWELSVNYGHMFDNGLSVSATATLADAVTTITKYGATQSIDDWYVGKTYGEIWGYRVDRLYQNSDFEWQNGSLVRVEANDPSNPANYQYAHYKMTDPNAPLQGRFNASSSVMFGPGDVKYRDLDGDGIINDGKRLLDDHGDLDIIGNTTPRYEYSFRLDLGWKGIDFSMFWQGIGKRDMWGSSSLTLPGFNSSDGAMAAAFADNFWYEEFKDGSLVDSHYDAFYPRAYNMGNGTSGFNLLTNDRYLLNMAYLRLKNVTLGYSLPMNLIRKINMQKARIYVSLENFLTFDHLKGMPVDPEVVAGVSSLLSSDYNLSRAAVGAPAMRTASFGLQLTF